MAAAQASVWVAEAQLTRAKVLWVPQLNIGGDYIRHDGGGPDFNKGILTAPSVNFFYGGGGLWEIQALTDVFFEPLVKRQVLNSRQADIQTAKNDAALMTATTYFDVHQHRGMYAGSLYCVERGRDLVERIASLSNELVPEVEVQRARNLLADLEQQATSARQAWRVSSARLTRVLRLNPLAVVVPLEHDHLQVTLIDPARPLPDLHVIALTNRPELASYQALVQAAVARIRREKGRMFLPTVLVNGFQTPDEMIQAGIFGMGTNNKLNQWAGRDDVSLQLMWELEGLGIGNLARIKEQRGEQSKAIIDFFNVQDMVAADVTRAQADLQSAAARVDQAERAVRTGHRHLQRQLRGPAAYHPVRRRPGPDQPAAGSRLRAPAHEDSLRRVLHDGRRLQPGTIRVCSTRSAIPPARSPTFGRRAPSNRSIRPGPIICPRWAMGRRRQPAETTPSSFLEPAPASTPGCRHPLAASRRARLSRRSISRSIRFVGHNRAAPTADSSHCRSSAGVSPSDP